MLEVVIPKQELFSESTEEFFDIPETKLQLEHSLLSIKLWESKWHKPFLVDKEKTVDEMLDYIRCMTINKNVDSRIYRCIPNNIMERIITYIDDPMTATTFSSNKAGSLTNHTGEYISAETIYYWMITLNIPVEFQKWHINQLMALIRLTNIKNSPAKKMSPKDAAKQRAALNAARRAKYNTKG